uniref:DUF58 domain-containing protein n=1 Tax=Roseobacter sp. HKCCA0434 TaxID=3079297 RepID=UPI002905B0B1
EHGRRRAGVGEEFWQYRQAVPGDAAGSIDWRRSARSDAAFVRQTEWSAPQSVTFAVDAGRAMDYPQAGETKRTRAGLLALSAALLLNRAGERIGLPDLPPAPGRAQVERVAETLGGEMRAEVDRLVPRVPERRRGIVVILSDFLGDEAALRADLAHLSGAGQRAVLVQVLDESELQFPFDGRVEFSSMTGATRFETERARSLREQYRARLAARQDLLAQAARRGGWDFTTHLVQHAPARALLWLHGAIAGAR